MSNLGGKKSLRMHCPHCGERGPHHVVRTDPSHYYWDDETTEFFKRIVGRDIRYRCRTKECSSCGKQFSSVEMPWTFLFAMINEIKRLAKEMEQLQAEKNRLEIEVEIETDESEELRTANEELEKQKRQLEAESACLKEGLLRISDMAAELATRKSMSHVIANSPNQSFHQTSCANHASA